MENESIEPATPAERMVPQSEVDKLVVGLKREAQEKAQAEAERYKREMEQMQNLNAPPQTMGMGGQQLDPTQIAKQAEESAYNRLIEELENERRSQIEAQMKAEANNFVREYEAKMAQGKQYYDDFEDVVKKVKPNQFTDVIIAAKNMDGTADIMYELAKNPRKLLEIDSMIAKSPELAQEMMAEIAASIKMNREALENKANVNSPLPRVKPSTAGTSDSTSYNSVRDFKNASWLRG